jgi:hypothetical protein
MRTYNTQHLHYCGVDLHARSLFVNILDDKGATRLERDIPASPTAFLDAVKPDGCLDSPAGSGIGTVTPRGSSSSL